MRYTLTMTTRQPLMGIGDIAKLLGVGRTRVQTIVTKPDFPAPEGILEVSRIAIWRTSAIYEWGLKNGRLTLTGQLVPREARSR